MPFPPTFKDIQDEVVARLRLEDDLDRAKVKDWINGSYMEACVQTEFFQDDSITSLIPSAASKVTVPPTLLYVDYIVPTQTDGTMTGPMQLVGIDVILQKRAWSGDTVSSNFPSLYAYRSSGQPIIEIWPGAAGGESLTFYGSRLPNPLVNDSDVSIIPEPFSSNILLNGACAQAAEFLQNMVALPGYQQANAQWIMLLRGLQNNRAGNSTQAFQITNQRVGVPSLNSADTPYNW